MQGCKYIKMSNEQQWMEAYVHDMVSIRISQRELELIKKQLYLKNLTPSTLRCQILDNQIPETLDQIIDYVLDCFLTEGLSSNDEPNKLGLELESLNSKFITEFQKVNDQLIELKKASKK